MSSVVSVRPQGESITHDALDLTVQDPLPPAPTWISDMGPLPL